MQREYAMKGMLLHLAWTHGRRPRTACSLGLALLLAAF